MSPTTIGGFVFCTFEELQTEFYARGYDYLNENTAGRTRAKRWLNQAYLELCEVYDWPFLETEIISDSPLVLDDLRHVLSVTTSDNRSLDYIDRRTLAKYQTVSDEGGTPCHWYLVGDTLYTNPGTTEVNVHYIRVPQELVIDEQPLVVPCRYLDIVIDGAVIRALKDSDNWDAVGAARIEWDRQVGAMANLLVRSSEPDYIVISEE